MRHGLVQTAQHGRVHYPEEGAGKSQVLVLLHRNGACAFQYEDVMAGFAERWRVLAMDMPRYGDSDPISPNYSIESNAQAEC